MNNETIEDLTDKVKEINISRMIWEQKKYLEALDKLYNTLFVFIRQQTGVIFKDYNDFKNYYPQLEHWVQTQVGTTFNVFCFRNEEMIENDKYLKYYIDELDTFLDETDTDYEPTEEDIFQFEQDRLEDMAEDSE